jgi:basic membrane protein A
MKRLSKKGCAVFAAAVFLVVTAGCAKPVSWQPGQPLAKDKIKIGVIYPNVVTPESGYDYMHYQGILTMQKALLLSENQIIRKVNVFEEQPYEVEAAIRECIENGANVIFALSWGYGPACEKMAGKFPNVIFAHATGTMYNAVNFTNYAGRMYQARYLSGVVAGLRTESGKIGYVAAMGKGNSEVTAGINAFALGVERVNPGARVYVKVTYSWIDPMGETDASKALIAEGCDVIAMHCNSAHPLIAAEAAGVWGIGYNSDMSASAPNAVLTSAVFDWGVYYTFLVNSVMDGSFTTEPYLGGLNVGMVGLTPFNEALIPPGTVTTVAAERRRIIEDGFNVFDGELETNDGQRIGRGGSTLSDSEIIGGIDWYYHNVIELR